VEEGANSKEVDMSKRGPFEVDDLVVLLLGAPSDVQELNGQINGITRLEKLIFLLEKEGDVGEWLQESPEFESHNFGPFSSKVYQAVEALVGYGLLEDSKVATTTTEDTWESENVLGSDAVDQFAERRFRLTDKGRRYYESLRSELPPDAVQSLSKFKGRFGSIPLAKLVRYVYQNYEQFTDKSLIRKRILGK
jgi:hypothetical protein